MRAAVVSKPGGPDALQWLEVPEPVPAPGEVVVEVRAASINPTDLAARAGSVPDGIRPAYVLGWDFAGEVVGTGERVVGMIPWYADGGRRGAYSERVAVPRDWLAPLPEGLGFAEAATVPLNALTAHQLLEQLQAVTASAILVTGASGGVGAFVTQLAARAAFDVTAIAGGGDEDFVQSLGARTVHPRGVDLATVGAFGFVIDAVPLGDAVLPAVQDGGRVLVTRALDTEAPRGIVREAMLVRPDFGPLAGLVDDVAAGRLLTRVDRRLPMHEAAAAHRLVEDGHPKGKVVLVR